MQKKLEVGDILDEMFEKSLRSIVKGTVKMNDVTCQLVVFHCAVSVFIVGVLFQRLQWHIGTKYGK